VTTKHEYRIERLSPENLYHLKALYKASLRKSVSLSFLRKKYDTIRFGAQWIGYLAMTPDGQPAAFYGIIPCHFKVDNSVLLAAQSADTMTRPSHRKKGLFMTLAKLTYALAKAEKIQFVFGFPNEQSYPGFVKLGWEFLPKQMQLFVIKGSTFPVASILLKLPVARSLYRSITESVNHQLTFLPSSEVGLMRDENFIRYKTGYSRTFSIKCAGADSWLKNDGALKVGYIHCEQKTSPQQLRNALTSTAKKLGCSNIILMTSEGSDLYNAFTAISSAKDGLPIGFYNLTDRKFDFSAAQFEYCDIDIF
jgi:hypothetical protein